MFILVSKLILNAVIRTFQNLICILIMQNFEWLDTQPYSVKNHQLAISFFWREFCILWLTFPPFITLIIYFIRCAYLTDMLLLIFILMSRECQMSVYLSISLRSYEWREVKKRTINRGLSCSAWILRFSIAIMSV